MFARWIENRRIFYTLLVAISLAFSALALLRDPLINDDGVLYLVLAREVLERGVSSAFSWFDKPAYSMLIAWLHAGTGISLIACAHLINAAFIALLVVNFTRFACAIGGDQRLAGWAALVILLFPALNENRSEIVRDFGFWALLVSGLLPLLRYQATQSWRDGVLWALSMLAAAAFRPEALVYAVLLPACSVAFAAPATLPLRLMSGARLYACLGVLLLPPILVLGRFDLLQEPLQALIQQAFQTGDDIAAGFHAAVARYAATVLDRRMQDLAALSLVAGLAAILLLKFLHTLGLWYCALLAWGVANGRARLPETGARMHRTLVLVAVLIVSLFLAYRQLLTGRYLMPLALLALVPVASLLRQLSEIASRKGRSSQFGWALGLLMAILLIDSFISFGTRKEYVHQTIAWMQANIPAGSAVFSNERTLWYYSGAPIDWQQMTGADALLAGDDAPLQAGMYWVLLVKPDDAAMADAQRRYAGRLAELQAFDGEHGRRIVIYRVAW